MRSLILRYRTWSDSLTPSGAILFAVAMGLVLYVLTRAVPSASGADRISFSINAAEPVIVQAKARGDAIKMSIHASEERSVSTATPIAFSVHDATALDGNSPKPDCVPARTVNRMLVIYPPTATVKVKVCDEFGCRYELRMVPHPILGELKKLSPKWSCGDKECDHFRLINADDPKQAGLLRELEVKRDDLPMLVKETDVEKRKKAAGMSGEDIAKLWNKWFVEPKAEETGARGEGRGASEKCFPQFGSDGHQWDYPGSIRDHLTDPRQVHHLPRAVVESWSDSQCVAWHNWHHEVLSGRRMGTPARPSSQQTQTGKSAHPTKSQPVSFASPLANRISAIAQATIRAPPPRMVAAANASDGHSRDAKAAKKKRSTLSRNGSLTSVAACARKSLGESSPSNKSACSTRSRC